MVVPPMSISPFGTAEPQCEEPNLSLGVNILAQRQNGSFGEGQWTEMTQL